VPLCAYQTAIPQSETRVDNGFITQYLYDAPADAVKVYLYGLMQCQSGQGPADFDGFARALHLDADAVKQAFAHWESMGLCHVGENAVSYLPIPKREMTGTDYPLSAFNQEIRAIFAPRTVSPGDFRRIYDWMDVYGIAENAIPLLIRYGRERMKGAEGRSVSAQISYINKIAASWSGDGVLSVLKAEGWIKKQELIQAGIHTLMRAMGMHRNPTQAEWDLFRGWLDKGFTVNAMTKAAERLTGSYTPSFKRLDDILTELYERGIVDEADIKLENKGIRASAKGAAAMMAALGVESPSPTAGQRDAYEGFLAMGFAHELILSAARSAREEGRSSTAGIKGVLMRWQQANAFTMEAAEAAEGEYRELREFTTGLFEKMGLSRRPNPGELGQVSIQLKDWAMEPAALSFAAESARGAKYPYRYYGAVVSAWHKAGITTEAGARAQEAQKPHSEEKKKVNRALDYEQRTYAPDEFDDLFITGAPEEEA